jgi:queuine tRNA-ribosyltransferase
VALDLPGYAIGGLSVGEPAETMYRMAEVCTSALPEGKPRYVMGVGTPENLLELISRGIDLFDCVLPTRNARNGTVFTWEGPLHYKAARHAKEFDIPLDPGCSCEACRSYSRGYLRHLFIAGEMLALRMATVHSLHFYRELMGAARTQILAGTFEPWRDALLARWSRKRAETQK